MRRNIRASRGLTYQPFSFAHAHYAHACATWITHDPVLAIIQAYSFKGLKDRQPGTFRALHIRAGASRIPLDHGDNFKTRRRHREPALSAAESFHGISRGFLWGTLVGVASKRRDIPSRETCIPQVGGLTSDAGVFLAHLLVPASFVAIWMYHFFQLAGFSFCGRVLC